MTKNVSFWFLLKIWRGTEGTTGRRKWFLVFLMFGQTLAGINELMRRVWVWSCQLFALDLKTLRQDHQASYHCTHSDIRFQCCQWESKMIQSPDGQQWQQTQWKRKSEKIKSTRRALQKEICLHPLIFDCWTFASHWIDSRKRANGRI